MIRQLSYLVFLLIMICMIAVWSANAETGCRGLECPICGEAYSEWYEYDLGPYMPAIGFSPYPSGNITFEMEQPSCPKCREKYQQKVRNKMLSIFNELIEEIKDENKNLKAINQEINKQKEIEKLENQIKRLKGERVEEDYGDLTADETWEATADSIIVFEGTTLIYDEAP